MDDLPSLLANFNFTECNAYNMEYLAFFINGLLKLENIPYPRRVQFARWPLYVCERADIVGKQSQAFRRLHIGIERLLLDESRKAKRNYLENLKKTPNLVELIPQNKLCSACLFVAHTTWITNGVKVAEMGGLQNDKIETSYWPSFAMEFNVHRKWVGGFGAVYRVTSEYGREYAIKRIPIETRDDPNSADKSVDLEEVQRLLSLDHPGIILMYSSWMEKVKEGWQKNICTHCIERYNSQDLVKNESLAGAYLCIKMQLCRYSLAEWLEQNNTLEARSLIRMRLWMKQIISAVEYLHENNFVHRDIKPGNILFSGIDKVLLSDFGTLTDRICENKSKDETQVETDSDCTAITEGIRTTGVGSPLYMSPEQLSNWSTYSSKTDIFPLGLVMAEISLVMQKPKERADIFNDYRSGKQCERINDAETRNYIEMLTQLSNDPQMRPTATQMLAHEYIAGKSYKAMWMDEKSLKKGAILMMTEISQDSSESIVYKDDYEIPMESENVPK